MLICFYLCFHSIHIADINGGISCVPWLIFEVMSTFMVEAAVEVIMILRSACRPLLLLRVASV